MLNHGTVNFSDSENTGMKCEISIDTYLPNSLVSNYWCTSSLISYWIIQSFECTGVICDKPSFNVVRVCVQFQLNVKTELLLVVAHAHLTVHDVTMIHISVNKHTDFEIFSHFGLSLSHFSHHSSTSVVTKHARTC